MRSVTTQFHGTAGRANCKLADAEIGEEEVKEAHYEDARHCRDNDVCRQPHGVAEGRNAGHHPYDNVVKAAYHKAYGHVYGKAFRDVVFRSAHYAVYADERNKGD